MKVPWQEIDQLTLQNLLEEFVTRDGTDYGEQEIELATRVAQVEARLKRGEAVIWYDEATESISIFNQDAVPSGGSSETQG